MPNRTALLVENSAARSLFIPFGPHDDGILRGAGGKLLLSVAGRAALLPGDQHRCFPDRAGNAFPERCAGGHGFGSGARVRVNHDFCVAWLRLDTRAGSASESPKIHCALEWLRVSGERFAERNEIALVDDGCPRIDPRWQRIGWGGPPVFKFVNGIVMQVVGKP